MRVLGKALCILALLTAPANASEVAEGVHAARVQLVEDLEAVARWCAGKKLFGKRDEVFERLIEFAPEHAEARKRLGYEIVNGEWKRSKKYKRPSNWSKDAIPEADQRLADAFEAYQAALIRIADAAKERSELEQALKILEGVEADRPDDDKLVQAIRRALIAHVRAAEKEDRFDLAAKSKDELARRFPDDPVVRELAGDVKMGDRWVLPETARAMKQRQVIAAAAKLCLAAAEQPKESELTKEEKAVDIPWTGAFVSRRMRVLGTSSAESSKAIAHACEAAAPFFHKVIGRMAGRNPKFTFVVFETQEHWDKYIETYAKLSDAEREAAKASRLSGFSFADGRYAIRHVGGPAFELDMAVDVYFQHFLYNTYCKWDATAGGWTPLRAWVNVGLSDYLTFRLIGTRLLTTVGGDYNASSDNYAERVPDLQRKWLQSAHDVLEREKVPFTTMMLGHYLGSFTKNDALAAYGLAGYVVEAHPGRIDMLLQSVGQNRPPEESFSKALHLSVSELHARLVRWLAEVGEAK